MVLSIMYLICLVNIKLLLRKSYDIVNFTLNIHIK